MKSYRETLTFNIPDRRGYINITPQVEKCLRESGIKEGLCLVNAMHITASVYINDDGRLWAVKLWLQLQMENWILAHGSGYFLESLTGAGKKGFW